MIIIIICGIVDKVIRLLTYWMLQVKPFFLFQQHLEK